MAGQAGVGFLVAGVQKGGTTALFDYLAEHPSLALPAIKEAHFFDDESGGVDWAAPDYAAYHALFAGAAPGALWGEATPIYLYWPASLERIAAYNPAMRFILLFRDPVERAWSHWRMERARGAEPLGFSDCIRQGRARVTRGDPAAPGHHRVHSYVERGFYGAQLQRLLTRFPREQVLCLRSADLAAGPEEILGQVCDFLHIGRFASVRPRQSHVGVTIDNQKTMNADDRTYLEAVYEQDMNLFRKLSGLTVSSVTIHQTDLGSFGRTLC
jgi:hypothetical protein